MQSSHSYIRAAVAVLLIVLLGSFILTCGKRSVEPDLPAPGATLDARFGASTTAGAPPLTVLFTDSSKGQPDFWFWKFGDGQTSFNQNPSHTYTIQGTYSVTLVVSHGDTKDSLTRANWIVVNDTIGSTAPVANFSAAPVTGPASLAVQFTNSSTGTINSSAWSFGDGGTSTQSSPNHLYTDTGTFTVRLIVSGPSGTDTLEKPNYIHVTSARPTAAFTAQPRSGHPPLAVQFTNQSTGDITSYQWTFGDGNTSTDPNPSHTYSAEGTYTVRLIVTGPGGSDTAEIADYIAVSAGAPVVSFTGAPTSGAAPLTVHFTNNTAGNVTSYQWSFGDGQTSTSTSPNHIYQAAGTYSIKLVGTGPGGSDSMTRVDYIVVSPPAPVAAFTGNPTSGAAPLSVQFTNTSSGQIAVYAWSFGDGSVSNAVSPNHVYNSPGQYTVRLIVAGPGGDDTLTRIDYINVTTPPPVAGFTGAPTSGTVPLTVQFSNTSTGVITSYAWQFGDGGTSTAASPAHTYEASGTYTVRLIVSGPGGVDTLLRTNYITVNPGAPVANFTADPTTGNAPLLVHFSNISVGQVSSRSWDFGDGQTSTAPNPDHTYQNAGTYTVRLIVTGPGGSDTLIRTDYIVVLPPKPVAAFSANTTSGPIPLEVQFTSSSAGQITSYKWEFGDGGTSTQVNPSHTYTTPGVYDVTLIVSGPGGTDTLTKASYITATSQKPVAGFIGNPTTGVIPLTVQFTNQSAGDITSYHWSFGDGSSSTDVSPSHIYDQAGVYDVRLIVTGPGGTDTLLRSNYIVATPPPPHAAFSGSPRTGDAPLTVDFTNASTGIISSYLWLFGDGNQSTAASPSHTYAAAGSYDVMLIAAGPGGVDTAQQANYITVTAPKPTAGFSGFPTSGAAPLNVQFVNTSTGEITSYAWDFGDGGTSTAVNPSHTYETPGTYSVSLVVTGPGGSDTQTRKDYIAVTAPTLGAAFTADPTTGVAPLFVTFTNQSTGTILGSEWDFGDGGTSTTTSPTHLYTNPGSYSVRLIVTGSFGADTLIRPDYITVTAPPPVAEFSADVTTGAAPLTVQFSDLSGGDVTAWAWDFGDGGTSTAQNPSHVYETVGTFTVKLTVTGPGGTDAMTKTDYITTTTVGSACKTDTLQLVQLGPIWPELVSGDCKLDHLPVQTTVSVTLFTTSGGTQLWATAFMYVEESGGDHSKGSVTQNLYLGYTAPSGFKISRFVSPDTASWSYADKDDKTDNKDSPVGQFRVDAYVKGDALCDTTLSQSHFTFAFKPVELEVCKTSSASSLSEQSGL